jgi:hypothetical protein
VLLLAPFVLIGGSFVLLAFPPTRRGMLWALEEDRPIEILTVAFFVAAAVTALRLALALRARPDQRWARWFYGCFALLLFLVSMEEISWGQRIIGFDTPPALREINGQGETTLHNIGPFQGRSEWVRLGFGLAGLLGISRGSLPALSAVAAPPVLWPWFLTIAAHASIDAYNDISVIEARFDYAVNRTSEMIELLMSVAVFLYLRLNSRRLRPGSDPTRQSPGHPPPAP